MVYRTVLMAARGDPGFLSALGRIAGRVARLTPIGNLVGQGIDAYQAARSRAAARVPTLSMAPQAGPGGQAPQRQVPGGTVGVSPLGTIGFRKKKTRRMNPGNARAARRAIRRIKGVRHLLQSIERELPRRKAIGAGSSRGVITRSEAARALRA